MSTLSFVFFCFTTSVFYAKLLTNKVVYLLIYLNVAMVLRCVTNMSNLLLKPEINVKKFSIKCVVCFLQ